jgi:glycolate oxidase
MSPMPALSALEAGGGFASESVGYGKVDQSLVAALSALVGRDHVRTGSEIAQALGFDAGTRHEVPRLPDVAVVPGSTAEVASVVALANRKRIPLTARGGGTGLAGGAVPLHGGILLDLGRLDRILTIDCRARFAEVEPGVKTLTLQNAAREQGLLYAGDPCSNDDCVLGGNIATNAGGNRAVKYGVTSDQVLSLEVVTALGQVTTLGTRLKKNSTGYNLVRLFVGSEGTLGIITKAMVKLRRLAPLHPDYLVILPDLVAAMTLVEALADDRFLDPITLEIIDRRTVAAMEKLKGAPIFGRPQGHVLIVQFEADSEEEVQDKAARLKQRCADVTCLGITRAGDSEEVWAARRTWAKALHEELPVSVGEDLVVPVDRLAEFIGRMQGLLERYGLDYRLAGHAGDGNMHINTVPGHVPLEHWQDTQTRYRAELYQVVYSLGGRLSGEHGIGLKRKKTLAKLIDPVELELMRSIKRAFDPNNILNPGKIFDLA